MNIITKIITTPTTQLGRASRFMLLQIKMWAHCIRLLNKNRSSQQAAALTYHTVFGIVPLGIVILMVFQYFPAYSNLGENFKNMLYEQLHLNAIEYPSQSEEKIMLTEHLDGIFADFYSGINKRSVTIMSVVIVIWAALGLLLTIERAFNNIWHIGRLRSYINRLINYWALLTLGPLLIGAGIYFTTHSPAFGAFQQRFSGELTPLLLSYIVSVIGFFLLYFVLPNTKVKVQAAIWGAAVAAFIWTAAKSLFGMYVTRFIPYSQIYGVLGLVPLGVFWIYIAWLIVLFGLQLTYTTQYLKTLDAAEMAAARRKEDHFMANDLTIINIVREIAVAFENNTGPISQEVICSKLDIPGGFGEKILEHLVDEDLIVATSEPRPGFVPARSLEDINLSQIVDAVATVAYAQPKPDQSSMLFKISQFQKKALEQYNLKQTIKSEGPYQEDQSLPTGRENIDC